jgi:hypothetical protein
VSQQINLFNPVFLRKKKYFSSKTMGQALGILAIGVLGFYGYAVVQSGRIASLAADVERQLGAEREQLGKLVKETGAGGPSKLLEEEIARVEARLKSGRELLSTLRTGELGNTDGFSRYLTAFARRALPGVWITGFTLGDGENDMVLRGRTLQAELIPAYIRALSKEDVMRGRKVVELRLSAHRSPKPPAAAAGAAAAAPAPQAGAAQPPAEFLEFSFVAPRAIAESAPKTEAVQPQAPGKGSS